MNISPPSPSFCTFKAKTVFLDTLDDASKERSFRKVKPNLSGKQTRVPNARRRLRDKLAAKREPSHTAFTTVIPAEDLRAFRVRDARRFA